MTLKDHLIENLLPSEHRDTAARHSAVAELWHPTRNGVLTPDAVTAGGNKKHWWQCEKGHEWQATTYSVKAGTACPYCAGKRVIVGETDLKTTHPYLLKYWSKGNSIAPEEVTAGSHKKLLWVCEQGHEWEAPVFLVTKDGCRCPYCSGKRAIPGETDLATLCPDLMGEWDFEKNTIDPRETTVASHDKAWWKCGLGHSYEAMIFSRTKPNGSGCPYCTGRKVLPGFNDLATLQPRIAQEWHTSLNGDLKPQDVTLGSNKKVWWRCGEGHVWQAAIYSRTRKKGAGCPVCAGMVKAPKPQKVRTAPRGFVNVPSLRP